MNDLKNIKNTAEAEAPATADIPARRRPSRPAAIVGCIAAAISLIAFLFLAYFQILAIAAALEPPPAEGIDARRLGLAIGWLISLICGAPQLLFGITAVICLKKAKKRTPMRFLRFAVGLLLVLALLMTLALTGYILVTN